MHGFNWDSSWVTDCTGKNAAKLLLENGRRLQLA